MLLSLEALSAAARIYERVIDADRMAQVGDQTRALARLSEIAAECRAERPVVVGVIGALLTAEPAIRAAVLRSAEHQRPTAPVCPPAANDHHPTSPEQPGPRIA